MEPSDTIRAPALTSIEPFSKVRVRCEASLRSTRTTELSPSPKSKSFPTLTSAAEAFEVVRVSPDRTGSATCTAPRGLTEAAEAGGLAAPAVLVVDSTFPVTKLTYAPLPADPPSPPAAATADPVFSPSEAGALSEAFAPAVAVPPGVDATGSLAGLVAGVCGLHEMSETAVTAASDRRRVRRRFAREIDFEYILIDIWDSPGSLPYRSRA